MGTIYDKVTRMADTRDLDAAAMRIHETLDRWQGRTTPRAPKGPALRHPMLNRTTALSLCVTWAEAEQLRLAARAAGMTFSSWAARRLLGQDGL